MEATVSYKYLKAKLTYGWRINVRENRKGNEEWTIQRNWKSRH
jgi:hypothetical protein